MNRFGYSVVIPTHNRRDLVLQAVESAWAQSHQPSEVIVVVDGDIDGTAEAMGLRHPGTEVIVLTGNQGAAAARNVGIRAATSEWVAFLDDDDLWDHRKQALLRDYVETHPECRALRSEFWLFQGSTSQAGGAFGLAPELVGDTRLELERAVDSTPRVNDLSYLDIEGNSLKFMFERNRGVMSGSVVHRSILLQIPPIPDDLRRGQDWLLFIYIAAECEWHLVRERLVYIRLHEGQITRSKGGVSTPLHITSLLHDAWSRYGELPGLNLRDYGGEYSTMIRGWVWSRIFDGDIQGTFRVYRAAKDLLPERTRRWSVWIPPQIIWRMQRLRTVGSAT